jgi:hypothetical protein
MISRTHDELSLVTEAAQIGLNDSDLSLDINRRGNVEMVARNHHDVIVLSRIQYPVELLEGVV